MDRPLRGFSLLEVALALGIAAVAILGLMAVFISGLHMAERAQDVTAATEVARQVLEEIKLQARQTGFGYIPAGTYTFDGAVDPAQNPGPAQFPPLPYPALAVNSRQFTVLVTGEELSSTLKAVTVEVHWGETSVVRLQTHLHS